jgi:sugar lactone lactonase YvrE
VFHGIPINAQAVPTSLAVGPDGALYVGELVGFPGQPGTSSIYRIMPGHAASVVASGLTAVTAIAFDREGRLLATEYSTGGLLAPPTIPGALVRVDISTGTVTMLPVSGLSQPTGIAVDRRGDVYVSNNGISTGAGEVLRITGLD